MRVKIKNDSGLGNSTELINLDTGKPLDLKITDISIDLSVEEVNTAHIVCLVDEIDVTAELHTIEVGGYIYELCGKATDMLAQSLQGDNGNN